MTDLRKILKKFIFSQSSVKALSVADRGNFGTTRCPVGAKKIYSRYVWKLDLTFFSVEINGFGTLWSGRIYGL